MSASFITPRRAIELARNRLDTALSVLDRNEDVRLAVDDVEMSIHMLQTLALEELRLRAKAHDR